MPLFKRPQKPHQNEVTDSEETRRKMYEELDVLISQGLVERVLLLGAELGGKDEPVNVTYIPSKPARQKREFEAVIRERVAAGETIDYRVTPEYESYHFVPVRLHLDAEGSVTQLHQVLDCRIEEI